MVAARVSGTVINVKVDDNQRVKAGDVLFELDPADYRTHVRQAEVNLAAAEAQEQAAQADLTITQTREPAAVVQSRAALTAAHAQADSAPVRTRVASGKGCNDDADRRDYRLSNQKKQK